MARIELKKMLPFTAWDEAKKRGTTDDTLFATLEYETAPTKAGLCPFVVVKSWSSSQYFTNIDDALEYLNNEIRMFARHCGWTPEGE